MFQTSSVHHQERFVEAVICRQCQVKHLLLQSNLILQGGGNIGSGWEIS